jgi:hypothetical protein
MPDLERIKVAATVLQVTPSYLAFGEGGGSGCEENGFERISLIGNEGRSWPVPLQELDRLGVRGRQLAMLHLAYDVSGTGLRRGSFALADLSVTSVSEPGVYAFDDGRGLAVASMSLRPSKDGSLVVVRSGGVTFDVQSEEIAIRGKVLAGWSEL